MISKARRRLSLEFSITLLLCFSNCISIQQGNPSLTVIRNHGNLGIYGKAASQGYVFSSSESCIKSFAGLISIGNASNEMAQLKGQIKEIVSIDHSLKTQYFFFQEYCTIVSGR